MKGCVIIFDSIENQTLKHISALSNSINSDQLASEINHSEEELFSVLTNLMHSGFVAFLEARTFDAPFRVQDIKIMPKGKDQIKILTQQKKDYKKKHNPFSVTRRFITKQFIAIAVIVIAGLILAYFTKLFGLLP